VGEEDNARSEQRVRQKTNSSFATPGVNIAKVTDPVFKVTPRGSKTGFLKRHSLQKFSKHSLTSVKNKDYITSTKLQFGFTPLVQSSKQPSEIYFDANIDTLQAPSKTLIYKKNEKIYKNYVTSVSRFLNNPVRKQDRKSHLNLLGIFDTRKYFFIPQNRRSEKFSQPFR
jgi:hypothetical protein